MGAFCVFGVSRTLCRKQAEKNTPTYVVVNDRRQELTAPEWGERVSAETDRLFAETIKQTRISPELDAPQFYQDWIAASPGEAKLTKIMCRGDKIDKHGAVVLRDGAPAQTWLDYDPAAERKIKAHPQQFAWASEASVPT